MSLIHPIPFSAAPFDRAAHHRKDETWLKNARQSDMARFLLWQAGKPLCLNSGPALEITPATYLENIPHHEFALSSSTAIAEHIPDEVIKQELFLGIVDDIPYFALNISSKFDIETSALNETCAFDDFRAASGGLSPLQAQMGATARSIFAWHARHGFCANCGAATLISEAGWKRECPACEAEHFPRVDPVAIMLATHQGKCLLGRQSRFAPGMYSCLAGFVEPGETLEQAAARELFEEAGVIATGETQYLFNQPWPWPSSLMVGMILPVSSDELNIDTSEIESARWFTKNEAKQILENSHSEYRCSPPIAIAHHILKHWVASD